MCGWVDESVRGNVFTNSQKGSSFLPDSHTIIQLLTSSVRGNKNQIAISGFWFEEQSGTIFQKVPGTVCHLGAKCIFIYVIYIINLRW